MRTFFITCHRSAPSVADLFRFLYRPDVHFIIHCDPKAPPGLSRLVASLAARFPNVHALPPRPVSWAGYSLVETVMDAMRCALGDLADWTHFFWIKPLRYTPDTDPRCKAIRVLTAFAEQLAQAHAHFIDTNEGVRLQAEQQTYRWRHLF